MVHEGKGDLPSHLYGTYKRYKADTESVIRWLLDTKNQRSAGNNSRSGMPLTAVDSVAKLLSLAHEVSTFQDPPVEAPQGILEKLRTMIHARTQCAQWFRSTARTHTDHQRNSSHGYFINVLYQVLALLSPRPAGAQPKEVSYRAPTASLSTKLTAVNRFQILDCLNGGMKADDFEDEDGIVGLPESPDSSASPVTDSDDSFIDITDRPEVEERTYQCYCLLQDVAAIRQYIRDRWNQFQSCWRSLLTVSLQSSQAVRVFRSLAEDFFDSRGHRASYEILFVNRFYREVCRARAYRYPRHHGPSHHHPCLSGTRVADVAELVMVGAWHHLVEHLTSTASTLTGASDILPATVTRSWASDRPRSPEKWAQDGEIIMELCRTLCMINSSGGPSALLLWQDLFVQELVHSMLNPSGLSLWLVAGAQLFIDAQHILQDRGVVTSILLTIRQITHIEEWYRRYLKCSQFPPRLSVALQNYQGRLRSSLARVVAVKRAVFDEQGRRLLSRHPVLCGLICFHLQLDLYVEGAAVSDMAYVTVTAVHAYNLLRQQRPHLCQRRWLDLGLLVQMYTAKWIFAGGIPTTKRQCHTQWLITRNMLVTSHARPSNRVRERRIRSLSRHRLPICHNLVGLDLERNHKHFDDLAKRFDMLLTVGRRSMRPIALGSTTDAELWKRFNRDSRLSPLELLAELERQLDGELTELLFDHLGLVERCLNLDQQLQAKVSGLAHPTIDAFCQLMMRGEHLDHAAKVVNDALATGDGDANVRAIQAVVRDFTTGPLDLKVVEEFADEEDI